MKALIATGCLLAIITALLVGSRPTINDAMLTSSTRVAAAFVDHFFTPALRGFHRDCGRYPSTDEGLEAVRHPSASTAEEWQGPYLREALPLDSWKNPYRYRCPGLENRDSYDLWSLGPDGIESSDDIVNWPSKRPNKAPEPTPTSVTAPAN